ncbi:MAG: hypothetical protein HKN26_10440 [Acidimicrobiales bacterium]|nr:hypothetical protein [Acidimicrobiales bacterium]
MSNRLVAAAVAVVVVIGAVLRFVAQTPMWLDEALSVNIAALGADGIVDGLRQDGHPPLYYFLLRFWTTVFGDGDGVARALSGVAAIAALPLMVLAGRRFGVTELEVFATDHRPPERRAELRAEAQNRMAVAALVLLAASPFAIRYATEARMYALVSLLALAVWVVTESALERPTVLRLAGVAVTAAALLYTHYWAIFFLAALGLTVLWQALGFDQQRLPTPARKVAGALVVGGLLFTPWLPVFLDQLAHTGTPWGERARPAEIASTTIFELGGGPRSEAQLVGFAVVVLVLVGLFGRVNESGRLEIDAKASPNGLRLGALVALTMGLGTVAAWATAGTYQPRYAAVVVPFVILLAARGLLQFRGISRLAIGGAVIGFALATAAYVSNIDRSQSEAIAESINEVARPGDLVVFCPDQLGPAASRYLDPAIDAVTYPELGEPERVDWRDYADRNEAADPSAFVDRINQRSSGTIFVVLATGYLTLEGQCERVVEELSVGRAATTTIAADADRYEPGALIRFEPAG